MGQIGNSDILRRLTLLGEALADRGGLVGIGGQLESLGPGRAVPAQPLRDLNGADPRLCHRLDPSAFAVMQTPCHTENFGNYNPK